MIHKILLITTFCTMTAMATTAQTIENKLDKLNQHPKTEEMRAKADVYLHRHTIMNDSAAMQTAQPAIGHKKKHKKSCTKQPKRK